MDFILKEGEGYPYPQSKEFHGLIKALMNQQVTITQEHLKSSELSQIARIDYLRDIEPELDKIIYQKANNIERYVKTFYDLGKKNGFKLLDVKAFTGNADVHALYNLSNYNFGLIKNLSKDLKEGIRYALWDGVSKDYGVNQIAAAIEKIPLQPLKIGNRLLDIPTRARMIAKTESVRSVNQGLLLSFKEYNVKKVDFFGGPNPCDDCQAIQEGGPYDIDNLPEGGSPFHPNCEDTMIPATDPADKPVDPGSYYNLIDGRMMDVPEDLLTIT